MQQHYKDQNVFFLSMTIEDRPTALKFVEEQQFDFPTITDYKQYIEPFLGAFPTNIFIDSSGVIRAIRGNVPLDSEIFMDFVARGIEHEMADIMNPKEFYQLMDAME